MMDSGVVVRRWLRIVTIAPIRRPSTSAQPDPLSQTMGIYTTPHQEELNKWGKLR